MIYTYDSSMTGSPVLSGTAGALRAVLKACLVDGFGAGAAASLTVASGVATLMFSAAHPYRVGTIVQVAGATPSGLSGNKRVLAIAPDRVTFAAPGIADGAASGTITHKVAPAGWQELFAGQLSNVIALQPKAPEATGCVLRMDDTGTVAARVVAYESMSDISTGVGPFPTSTQVAGGMYWPKSDSAQTSPRAWRVVADECTAHVWLAPSVNTHGLLASFGDIQSFRSGDAWGCMITGGAWDAHSSGSDQFGCLCYGSGASGNAVSDAYVARAHTGLGASQLVRKVSAYNFREAYAGTLTYNSNGWPYPNGPDNSLRLAALEVAQGFGGVRGRVAGVYHSPQVLGDAFGSGDRIDGQGDFAGRTFMALRAGPPGADRSRAGTVFVDVTGPWRT